MTDTLKTAQLLLASGVAAIPVNAEKRPLIKWSPYIKRLPTDTELEQWFARDAGIALVAGRVQCLDFDEKYSAGIFKRFCQRAEECGIDQLISSVIMQQTPSGGYHLVWICDGALVNNQKLAQKANFETLIETRGEGGYFLIAPSPGYKLLHGDWSSIPAITEDDRDALLNLARTFDERPPEEIHHAEAAATGEATPGDDFDARADVPALLKQHGWKPADSSGRYWTRPGKNKGISASWDVVPGRFYVFTSSTAFEPNHVYRPWHVYAVLECAGDYSRAASELRRQGFGAPTAKPKQTLSQALDEFPTVEPPPPAIEGIDPDGMAPTTETEDEKLWRLMRVHEFDETQEPPPTRPVYKLGPVVICTPGNLTAITAQAKVGKSSFVGAMKAATMAPLGEPIDCLGVESANPDGRAVVYLDTEQSHDDFWHSVQRAKRRAGVQNKPDWLCAYTLTSFKTVMTRKAVSLAMANLAAIFGGIHSVIIDGVADLVLDVNDAEECNGLVAELHALAIRYDCPVICVIHKNPGTDKTRGHLGSQIERKAETNLALEREDEVTVVYSERQRRAPILKKDGLRFRWDDDLKMHVTVNDDGKPRDSMRVVDLKDLALEAFDGSKSKRHAELVTAISKARDVSESTAKNRIKQMRSAGILFINQVGHYTLENTQPQSV